MGKGVYIRTIYLSIRLVRVDPGIPDSWCGAPYLQRESSAFDFCSYRHWQV